MSESQWDPNPDPSHEPNHGPNHGPNHEPAADAGLTELEVLLSRAVAGDRTALDEVRRRGTRDASVLDELALWQADELRLARVARELHATADRVETPRAERGARRWSGLGWAVAAVLAVVWSLQALAPSNPADRRASVAGVAPGFASSDEAFDAYLSKAREEGVVTGDVAPPTLLRSRELGGGRGFEVVIVRQIIERRVSPEIYRVAPMGETGQLRQILVRPRTDLVQ